MSAAVQVSPSRPGDPLRAAIYCRVSTSDQTLEGQEADLLKYCHVRGWEPVVFRDVQSGAATTRPGLEAMMQAARRGEVSAIVAVKLDRIGRSLVHLAVIVAELSRLRLPIICTTQGIDTSDDNPVGRLQLGVLMAVAEFERALIRERTLDGLRAARARGSRLGRPPTITAEQREQILRLHHDGQSLRAIGRVVQLAPSSVWLFLRPRHGAEKGAA